MKKRYTLSIISILLISTVLCSFLALPVSATAEAEATALAKIDPALLEKMEAASPDEKLPVVIWYEDIDQTQVDELTIEKVGFTQEDIDLNYEMPSTKLVSSFEKGELEAEEGMQAYLKRTEAKRESERKMTNEFIAARREFSREKYNGKSSKVINDLTIKENDIVFNSKYSPMIIAELTCSEIYKSAISSSVETIYSHSNDECVSTGISTAMDMARVSEVNDNGILGLTGNNIKVGIIEEYAVLISETAQTGNYIIPTNPDPTTRYTDSGVSMKDYGNVVVVGNTSYNSEETHPSNVANTLLTVAPNIKLYSSNYSYANIEAMLDDGVQLLSCSLIWPIFESSFVYDYTSIERWFDHIISVHNITVINAAGNYGHHHGDFTYYIEEDGQTKEVEMPGPRVGAPGMAYNVITVGAYCNETETYRYTDYESGTNETITVNLTPNTLYVYSAYKNRVEHNNRVFSGCEKPDVIAPASFNGKGTSNAAPFVAGMIALMYELKPSLASYPQAVKAIVLASCHKKVTQIDGYGETEDIYDGITDRQGAGAPDAWSMMSIVCQGTYGIGIMNSNISQKIIRFTQPNYGASNMNISLAWLKNNSYETGASHTNPNVVHKGEIINLDMDVYRNGSLFEWSDLANSSTEMTYFLLDSSYQDYEVRINKISTTTEDVRYGYAYSTDKMLMPQETNEGVYRIKNLETDTYLTLDASTGEIKHQAYADSSIQEWIVRQSAGYQISSAYGTTEGIINRSTTALNSNSYKATLGNNTLNFSMLNWYNNPNHGNKGGVVLYSYIGGTQIFLDYFSNYVTLSSSTSNLTNSKIWVLEKINYIRGDTNADGKYNVRDATLLQKYLANTQTLNNLQLFLADANCDGTVTIKDVSKIQNDIVPTT